MTADVPDWTDALILPAQKIDAITVTGGNTTTNTYTLPAGTQSIRLLKTGTVGNNGQIKVTGVTSGQVYLNQFGGDLSFWSANNPLDLLIATAYDAQIQILVTVQGGSGPCTLYVQANFLASAVAIALNQNAFVQILGQNNQSVSDYFDSLSWVSNQSFLNGLNVSRWGTKPALWEAANLKPILINRTMTAGVANRVNLLAGVATQTIYMHAAVVDSDTGFGGGIFLCDGDPNTTGSPFDAIDAAATNEVSRRYCGAPLTNGNGLYVYSEVGGTIRGYVSVSQG